MNTLSLRLRYRPVRIGWCVAQGDFEALRQAMRLSFTMWGGRFNPIIPTSDPAYADRLARLFRVDALHASSADTATRRFVDSQEHLPWPLFSSGLFSGLGENPRRPRAQFADVSHPILRNYEEHFKNNPISPSAFRIHQWAPEDPLADFFLSTYGSYPDPAQIGIDYAGLERRYLSAQTIAIPNGAELPPFEIGTASVAILNRDGIDHHHAIQNYWDEGGLYIGAADDFDDLVTYWNLRAAEIRLSFFDPRHEARMSGLKAQAIEIAKQTPRQWGDPSVAVWSRTRLSHAEIDALVPPDCVRTIHVVDSDTSWNGYNIKAPIPIFGDASALASVDESRPRKEVSFAVNDQPFVRQPDFDEQHYVLSVDPGIGLFGDERTTLHTPFIPELNEFYGRNCYFEWDKARAEPDSLGFVTSISTDHIRLRGLDVSELVSAIFRSVGVEATPSKAGRICSTLIGQMGGLSGCRVFKIEGVRSLIESHNSTQSFSRSDAMQVINGQGDTRPLNEYQRLYIEPRRAGEPLKNDAVLGYLLDKGVFRVGLNFKCPSCALDFWRRLDDTTIQLECEYCGHRFNGSRQLRDKNWAFRRSGLFGRDDNQEGAIPVTLTLQQLVRRGALSESIFCTAMELDGRNVGLKKCETDFVIIAPHRVDQKIDVVIGECKTRGPITADDVEKLTAVADAFPTDRYNTYVVFARLTAFTKDELEIIATANGRHRLRVILLTERELEPYFVYERTALEFNISRHAVGFDDMARVTDQVFYQDARNPPPDPITDKVPGEIIVDASILSD